MWFALKNWRGRYSWNLEIFCLQSAIKKDCTKLWNFGTWLVNQTKHAAVRTATLHKYNHVIIEPNKPHYLSDSSMICLVQESHDNDIIKAHVCWAKQAMLLSGQLADIRKTRACWAKQTTLMSGQWADISKIMWLINQTNHAAVWTASLHKSNHVISKPNKPRCCPDSYLT